MPRWPLHPIGLLMVDTFYGREAWFSVLAGWLLKALLVHFGGARLHRAARPAFMGLIVGEVLAAILWGIVSSVLAAQGLPYVNVPVQPA
jgi:hypothetical protein